MIRPQNAYYTELGLEPSPLQTVDLMHDVELGLEKQVLLHHLRIFNAIGKGTVEEFDTRSAPPKAPMQPLLWPFTDSVRSQRSGVTLSGGLVEVFLH